MMADEAHKYNLTLFLTSLGLKEAMGPSARLHIQCVLVGGIRIEHNDRGYVENIESKRCRRKGRGMIIA
jgi:hypothetical protein